MLPSLCFLSFGVGKSPKPASELRSFSFVADQKSGNFIWELDSEILNLEKKYFYMFFFSEAKNATKVLFEIRVDVDRLQNYHYRQ